MTKGQVWQAVCPCVRIYRPGPSLILAADTGHIPLGQFLPNRHRQGLYSAETYKYNKYMREQRHAGTVVVKKEIQGQKGHERTETCRDRRSQERNTRTTRT